MNIEQQLLHATTWEERYRLIIQAGKNLPIPNENELAQMEIILGCEVQVWFKFIEKNDRTSSSTQRDYYPHFDRPAPW